MKKKAIIIIFFLCGLFFDVVITSKIDFNRINKNTNPIFSFPMDYIKDGGTKVYLGMGYQIISWHQLYIKTGNKPAYMVGTELHYFPKFKDWLIHVKNMEPEITLKLSEE